MEKYPVISRASTESATSKRPPAVTRTIPSDMLNPDDMMSQRPTLPGSPMATGKQGGIVGTGLFNGWNRDFQQANHYPWRPLRVVNHII